MQEQGLERGEPLLPVFPPHGSQKLKEAGCPVPRTLHTAAFQPQTVSGDFRCWLLDARWSRLAAWATSMASGFSYPPRSGGISPCPVFPACGGRMSPCSDSVTRGGGPSPPHRWSQTWLSSLPRLSCTRGQRWTVPASPPAGPRSPRPPSPPSSWAVACCPPALRRTRGEGSWGRGPLCSRFRMHILGERGRERDVY